MSEPMLIDGSDQTSNVTKKTMKRKRTSFSVEEKEAKIEELRVEMKRLYEYYSEVLGKKVLDVENMNGFSLNAMIACMLEESNLSLSKLVDVIFEKISEISCSNSKVSVKSAVILVGQRMFYGVPNEDADVLEDESESALWCWETRDLKLLPKSVRATLKVRRTCRKKIHERIFAVSALLTALQKLETDQNCSQELIKASEKLGKVLNEADIRLLVESMEQKNGAEMAEKSVKREVQLLIKQMERSKREAEKEKKRMDREVQKEKLKSEKELKRLQLEAEKEGKKFEKEESKLRKQMMREQEEAEKERRRKDKEEAEVKKKLTLQKQASVMERFLKRSKTNQSSQNSRSTDEPASDFSHSKCEKMPECVTLSMDSVLSRNDDLNADDLWKSHLTSWHCLGRSIHSKGKIHWGIRRKPKTDLVKELKLTDSRGLTCDNEDNTEKLADGWVDSNSNNASCNASDVSTGLRHQKVLLRRQLLQFDKCHRPAFYGVWAKKSQVVGARHPFAMDPDLDYEVDSDEEWEEEEPGESLSDCDKDDNECLEEESSRGEDEDESEDGFFVPDGYLSDEEGVQVDKMESHDSEGPKILSSSSQEVLGEEFATLLRQQKYLHNLTEQALRKNKPLIILNLMHEKAPLLLVEELTGNEKAEQMCLSALAICSFPGHSSIPISICNDVVEVDTESCPSSSKASTSQVASLAALADSDLPQIVSVIQSCSQSINKVVESLQLKFPSFGKSQLKNKVRETAEFIDGRWQVKKDILEKLGLSPEKTSRRTKNIATFFSKRCLPPSGKSINLHETSPEACKKTSVSIQPQQECTYKQE